MTAKHVLTIALALAALSRPIVGAQDHAVAAGAVPGPLPSRSPLGVIEGTVRSVATTSGLKTIRLRDVRFGRIVATQVTKNGKFAFSNAEPGSYVLEMLGDDQSVIAVSPLVYVNGGDKLSVDIVPGSGLGGWAMVESPVRPTAPKVLAAGAAEGVLSTSATGQAASPVKPD